MLPNCVHDLTRPSHNGLHLSLSCSELQERTHPLCCGGLRNNSCRSQMMALKSRFKAWRESAYESIATASRYTSLSTTNRQNVFKLFVCWRQVIAQLWSWSEGLFLELQGTCLSYFVFPWPEVTENYLESVIVEISLAISCI